MTVGSVAVDTALLILKIAFLVLLYLFIWRIVRTASRDLGLPQESFILAPSREGGVATTPPPVHSGRLVVVKSPELEEGLDFELNSAQMTIGRGRQNDVALQTDEYASARHARLVRPDRQPQRAANRRAAAEGTHDHPDRHPGPG